MRPAPRAALSGAAFATLVLIALMMGANHVAARVAFDHGVDVATAVTVRSVITASVVGLLLLVQRVPVRLTARHRRALPAVGLLVGVQSLCLYSAVGRGCPSRWRCWHSTPTCCGRRCGPASCIDTAPSVASCWPCR